MVLQKQVQAISGLKQHLLLAWVCRLSVWHCFRSWGQVQGLLHVQVSVSRLKECLPGARPFLMVKDRRARAELIKHIYSFSSDFVHIAFPHVPLVKPSHLIGLISTGREYAGLEGEIFEPSALFCF